jgi:hypothetical protein
MKEASMATSGVDAVTLDPWHEPGIPLEQQYRSWKQRIKAPYDKHEVDASKSSVDRAKWWKKFQADHDQLAASRRPERAGDHHRL